MKSKHFVQSALILFVIGFSFPIHAQTVIPEEKTTGTSGIIETQTFTWMETTDRWNYSKEFSYVFDTPASTLTPKGGIDASEKFATRGPVLARECYGLEDPVQCTKDYINSQFQNRYHPSIVYPVAYSGTEYVVFDLDEKGKVVGSYHVVQQATVCEPCAQAAVNDVAKLEGAWSPAMLNGNTVKSTVVVPVSFYVTAPLPDDDQK